MSSYELIKESFLYYYAFISIYIYIYTHIIKIERKGMKKKKCSLSSYQASAGLQLFIVLEVFTGPILEATGPRNYLEEEERLR